MFKSRPMSGTKPSSQVALSRGMPQNSSSYNRYGASANISKGPRVNGGRS